jgi:hypothetical protein
MMIISLKSWPDTLAGNPWTINTVQKFNKTPEIEVAHLFL